MTTKVRIEKLIYEGWGIGHDQDGRTLFVSKAVPGDIVEVEITKEKKSYAECKIKKILEPSLKRVYPECPYFNNCGGCDHQNISYPYQLKYKAEIFAEALTRQGITLEPEPIMPGSESIFYYRNSIRYFFKLDSENQIEFARQSPKYFNGLTPIKSCLLQSDRSNDLLVALKKAINKQVDDKSSLWQLKIREGKFTNEFMIEIYALETKTASDTKEIKKVIKDTLSQFSEIKSIYFTLAHDKSLKHARRTLLYGSPIIHEKIGKFTFQISPESFFQTNSLGVKTLYNVIKKYADVKMGDSVLDLFCGTGTIGIYLSTLAKEVIGVEIVSEAIRDANDNARINKIQNCTFICQDSEEFLINSANNLTIKQFNNFDVAIVDPPRAGLTKRTIELLSKSIFKRLIYVSCNPATFARDIKLFEEYEIKLVKVQPIDMFPQTHHIECVGLLQKLSTT